MGGRTSEDVHVHVQVPLSLRIHPVLMLTWRFLARKNVLFPKTRYRVSSRKTPHRASLIPGDNGAGAPGAGCWRWAGSLAWRPANVWVLRLFCAAQNLD